MSAETTLEVLTSQLDDLSTQTDQLESIESDQLKTKTTELKKAFMVACRLKSEVDLKFADTDLSTKAFDLIQKVRKLKSIATGKPLMVSSSTGGSTDSAPTEKKSVSNDKELCKFGSDCSSNDPKHFNDFIHYNHPKHEKMVEKYNETIYEENRKKALQDPNRFAGPNAFLTDDEFLRQQDAVGDATSVTSRRQRAQNRAKSEMSDDEDAVNDENESVSHNSRKPKSKRRAEETEDERQARLAQLLKKTESYMRTLTMRIRKNYKKNKSKKDGMVSTAEVRDFLSKGGAETEGYVEQTKSCVGGTLMDYQKVGLRWMVTLQQMRLNGILADEMGLGKTVQCMALLAHLLDTQDVRGPHLVVAPLSTLSSWTDHFEKWCPAFKCFLHRGEKTARKDQLRKIRKDPSIADVIITTYEMAIRDKEELVKYKFKYCIIDEAHRLKNQKSRLFETLNECSTKHRLLLTGTPLQNNLNELWSLLNFILPSIFDSAQSFEQWFCMPFANQTSKLSFKKKKGKGKKKKVEPVIALTDEERLMVVDRLHRAIDPFLLRRVKRDVLPNLAKKEEIAIKCPMSGMQIAIYKSLLEHGGIHYKGEPKAKYFNNILMTLRKCANHPYMFQKGIYDITNDIAALSGKFALLDHLIPKMKEFGHRILIFCQLQDTMDILSEYFDLRDETYLRIDGSTPSEDRIEYLNRFNASSSSLKSSWRNKTSATASASSSVDPSSSAAPSTSASTSTSTSVTPPDESWDNGSREDSPVVRGGGRPVKAHNEEDGDEKDEDEPVDIFLLSTRACGLGLNLYTADTVILFDSDWNPQQDLQAQARAHRIGQLREVRVFRLISEQSVEEAIYTRAQKKLDLERKAIECGKFDFSMDAVERKAFLTQIMSTRDELKVHDFSQLDRSKVNKLLARGDEAATFDAMDADTDSFQWVQLSTEEKLPDWLQVLDPDAEKKIVLPAKRSRKKTKYSGVPDDVTLALMDELQGTGDFVRQQSLEMKRIQRQQDSVDRTAAEIEALHVSPTKETKTNGNTENRSESEDMDAVAAVAEVMSTEAESNNKKSDTSGVPTQKRRRRRRGVKRKKPESESDDNTELSSESASVDTSMDEPASKRRRVSTRNKNKAAQK